MKIFVNTILLVMSFSLSLAQCDGSLVWSDEFNGTSLDLSKWSYDIGTGCPSLCGWGNNEQQYYTNLTQNVSVSGGYLHITALHQPNYLGSGANFTSGRIHTRTTFSRTYGRFEARIRLPIGVGTWPAFWMLPTANVYGGWPTSGEIDIMEYRGDITNRVDGTLHYGSAWPNNQWDGNYYTLPVSAGNFNDDFHLFAVEWSPGQIRWYVDEVLFKTETQTPNSLNPPSNHPVNWPWNQNFYIILNYALGGWYSGNPSTAAIVAGTTFPQTMQVDYVRVYDMVSVPFAQQPYNGTPSSIIGTIQAEHYDIGCNGDAWFDTDDVNNGGRLRHETPDIEICADIGGGHNIGWTASGEWLEYTINVPYSGTYNLAFRIASPNTTGTFRIEINGTNVTGIINVPNTGGWQNWQTITRNNISLTSGIHILRLYIENGGFNINHFGGTLVSLPIEIIDIKLYNENNCRAIKLTFLPDPTLVNCTLQQLVKTNQWKDIHVIPLQDVVYSPHEKIFYDCMPSNSNETLYRIAFLHNNGLIEYSNLISFTSNIDANNLLKVYPIPVSDQVTITGTREQATVTVYNVSGVLLQLHTYTNISSFNLDLSDLQPGVYMLKIETEQNVYYQNIIKQ